MSRLDEAAFAALHARTAGALRAYVYRVVGNAADADDIVQEAFLRMLRGDVPVDSEEHLRRYLYRVASNLVVDRWRRRRHEQPEHLMPEQFSAPPHYENDASVAKIFAELKPRDRALLWLAYVEGESHEEIAASLGVGRRGVRVMLFRARRRLRDLLQARGIPVNS
ncbi:MAG TPA: sigma-70 family RNA polymerase sigma factor [Vicinamibacterales bacterium]|nr:sigma-70 family RNA polymerase sigma factor [Vicinamibacterales bacterium]